MKKQSALVVLILGLMISLSPSLAETDEVQDAYHELNEIISLTNEIKPWVKQRHEARLLHIRLKTQEVLASLDSVGLGNFETISLYQQLDILFTYSVSFFKMIEKDLTKEKIRRLAQIGSQISEKRGFKKQGLDRSPYTRVTAGFFDQLHRLLSQLKDSTELPEDLRKKLEALNAPIAAVIAKGRADGDRPKVHKPATLVCEQIKALYADIERVQRSNTAFQVIMDFQGLNEVIADYLQMDKELDEDDNDNAPHPQP